MSILRNIVASFDAGGGTVTYQTGAAHGLLAPTFIFVQGHSNAAHCGHSLVTSISSSTLALSNRVASGAGTGGTLEPVAPRSRGRGRDRHSLGIAA